MTPNIKEADLNSKDTIIDNDLYNHEALCDYIDGLVKKGDKQALIDMLSSHLDTLRNVKDGYEIKEAHSSKTTMSLVTFKKLLDEVPYNMEQMHKVDEIEPRSNEDLIADKIAAYEEWKKKNEFRLASIDIDDEVAVRRIYVLNKIYGYPLDILMRFFSSDEATPARIDALSKRYRLATGDKNNLGNLHPTALAHGITQDTLKVWKICEENGINPSIMQKNLSFYNPYNQKYFSVENGHMNGDRVEFVVTYFDFVELPNGTITRRYKKESIDLKEIQEKGAPYKLTPDETGERKRLAILALEALGLKAYSTLEFQYRHPMTRLQQMKKTTQPAETLKIVAVPAEIVETLVDTETYEIKPTAEQGEIDEASQGLYVKDTLGYNPKAFMLPISEIRELIEAENARHIKKRDKEGNRLLDIDQVSQVEKNHNVTKVGARGILAPLDSKDVETILRQVYIKDPFNYIFADADEVIDIYHNLNKNPDSAVLIKEMLGIYFKELYSGLYPDQKITSIIQAKRTNTPLGITFYVRKPIMDRNMGTIYPDLYKIFKKSGD